ncbi:MAG: hypothetical protein JXR94_11290, partial [Candidatus Hydrogenedentes bacterium]|nr:hypothetical protein [Candidatus Hydrogenedentota bacterium]
LSTCAIRQAGDMAGAIRRWLHDRIWTWMDLTFVVVYFGINLRDTGLLGRGAWRLWRERLLPGPNWRWRPGAPPVWLHVAGPGDARAAERLIHALRAIEPDLPLFITCGTVPARSYCEAHFPAAGVRTAWLPFDTPRGMRRALRRLDPRAFVCAQGEFWPNLVRELHRAGVPDVVLRVDMLDWDTQAEFPGWVRPWYEEMLSLVNRFSVRAPLFKERLLRSGVRDERIVVGHDYRVESLPPPDASRAAEFAGLFGATEDCPLVVLASPRVDEVRALAPLLAEPIRNQAFRFLVAPAAADIGRRAERVLRGAGFRVVRRSELAGPAPEGAVIMLDTHGELYAIFAAARAVVIGDTFPPAFSVGANVWEPLRQGAAIVYGPSFAPTGAMARLEGAGAARRVPSWERLPAALDDMLARPIERRAVCEATAAAIEDEPSASWLDADVVLALVREQAAARADAGRWRTGGLRPRAEVRSTVLDALSWAPEAD